MTNDPKGNLERMAVAQNLRNLADEVIDRIDGAEESRGQDIWLTTLADGLRHAALLLDQDAKRPVSIAIDLNAMDPFQKEAYAEGFRRGVEAAADLLIDQLGHNSADSWLADAIRALRPEGEKT